MLYYIFRYTIGYLIALFMRIKVINRHRLRIKGPAILVCNHSSMADPVMLAIATPRPIHFMAKAELFSNPVKAFLFNMMLVFPVKRHTADISAIKKSVSILKNGGIFGIFPEGTRSITGELDELEKGAAFISMRSGAPVIPVFISPDSYRKLRLKIIVGEPVSVEGLEGNAGERIDRYTERMTEALQALKDELEHTK